MQLVVAFFVLFSIFCSSHKKTYVSVYTYYIPPSEIYVEIFRLGG